MGAGDGQGTTERIEEAKNGVFSKQGCYVNCAFFSSSLFFSFYHQLKSLDPVIIPPFFFVDGENHVRATEVSIAFVRHTKQYIFFQ